jgi:hypothetical protein
VLVLAGSNLVFAAAFLYALRRTGHDELLSYLLLPQGVDVIHSYKTNTVVRRLHFHWSEVESDDYATYIENLRAVGCPESTIRDIIIADVDQFYARKRAAVIVTPEYQWWRSEPEGSVIEDAERKQHELDAERRALLTRLLGPDWEPAADSEGRDIHLALTGPVLGDLPSETKQTVIAILDQARRREQEYWEQQGDKVDPRKLAELSEQTRAQLAKVLTADQLEEYLLRYSQSAMMLRQELRGIDVTPDEFRALFRARDPLTRQIQLQFAGDDPESARQRRLLEERQDAALKAVLGPERYRELSLRRDPVYQQTKTTVEQLGVPERLLEPLYQISQLAAAERKRIQENTQLNARQKSAAMESIRASEQNSLQKLLGDETYARYAFYERYGVVPREVLENGFSNGTSDQVLRQFDLVPAAPEEGVTLTNSRPLPPLPPVSQGTAAPTEQQAPRVSWETYPPPALRPDQ